MGDASANIVVPGGQIPLATPTFAGSAGPAVPSFGQSAATPDPSMQVNDMVKNIMQRLAQTQHKTFAGAPVPAAVPGMQDPRAARNIGMDTANPNAWGKQRLMAGVQTMIANAVAKNKQQKLLKAESDWTYMGTALNELYAAQATGDPKAVAAAQQKVDVVMSDPKKLKEMAKALNQDWLNPEKTTVYGEALKKVTAKAGQDAQSDANKKQAAQGLKGMFQKLLQKQQQPQLTDEQKQAMSKEILAKAPTSMGGETVKEMAEGAKAVLELEQASKDARQLYDVKIGADGTAWAYNKNNPREAFKLQDMKTQEPLTGQLKAGAAPKVLMNKGVPYAMQVGPKILTPESPEWNNDYQKVFDAAIKSGVQVQQLRIDPIIADQIGAPPNPDNFKRGTSDPAYAEKLKEYGEKAMAIKMKMNEAAGIARAKASNDYKIVEVTDFDGEGLPFTHYTTGAAALAAGLGSATTGGKNLSRSQQIEDIEVSSKKLRESLDKVGKFTPEKIAVMQKALQEGDETVASAEMQALANEALDKDEFQTILWIKHLNERAMSLRGIAGMGQGAQDLRNAIRSMLPNIGTGSPERMKTMLDAFDNQVSILKKGVPQTGGQKAATQRQQAAEMETQTYNGATYQRKKGSSDAWTLVPK